MVRACLLLVETGVEGSFEVARSRPGAFSARTPPTLFCVRAGVAYAPASNSCSRMARSEYVAVVVVEPLKIETALREQIVFPQCSDSNTVLRRW